MAKLKRVIVNKNKVKSNRIHGTHEAVLSIHEAGEPVVYGHQVEIVASRDIKKGEVVGTFFYRPQHPLPCGATVFYETRHDTRARRTKKSSAEGCRR
jgi:hypothetical protein